MNCTASFLALAIAAHIGCSASTAMKPAVDANSVGHIDPARGALDSPLPPRDSGPAATGSAGAPAGPGPKVDSAAAGSAGAIAFDAGGASDRALDRGEKDARSTPSADGAADRPSGASAKALVVGNVKTVGDPVFRKRLGELGFSVVSVLDTDPAPAGKFDVILITESAESDNVGTKYTTSTSPIVTSENRLISRLGMSSAPFVVDRKLDNQRSITIINPSSPLAASLSGTVDVYSSPGTLDFAVSLAPSAITVATPTSAVPEAATKFVLFAYEAGAVMSNGKPAPARRVAWFPEDEDVARMTAASWKIFDACIRWAAGKP